MSQKLTSQQSPRLSRQVNKQLWMRFLTYGLMTVATIVGLIVCVAWSMGFRFDLGSGQLSQVTLLQLNSFPRGASVDIGMARLANKTETRINVSAGKNTVKMSLLGYREWSKTISAQASSVRWLNYIRLIPRDIHTDSIKYFYNIDDIKMSPDKKWIFTMLDKKKGDFWIFNVENTKDPISKEIILDPKVISKANDNLFKIVEWSSNSRYILISHQYDNNIEYLIYDIHDQTTKNLTHDFKMHLDEAHFLNNGQSLLAINNGDLRRFDYGDNSVSSPLASNVVQYTNYGNNKIAVLSQFTNDSKPRQEISIYANNKLTNINTYNNILPTKITLSQYNGTDYLAIAREESTIIILNPLKSKARPNYNSSGDRIYLGTPINVDWLINSHDGRFVLAGKAGQVVSYDIETNEKFEFKMNNNFQPKWLDNYHLLDNNGRSIEILDFDGTNRQQIVSGSLPALLSRDEKYLFSIDSVAGGMVLQRSNMTVTSK